MFTKLNQTRRGDLHAEFTSVLEDLGRVNQDELIERISDRTNSEAAAVAERLILEGKISDQDLRTILANDRMLSDIGMITGKSSLFFREEPWYTYGLVLPEHTLVGEVPPNGQLTE